MPFLSVRLIFLQSVDSTNNYAMAQVHAGLAKHGNIYVAFEQTAGKGQRGKAWQTGNGQNIAMSLVLQPDTVPVVNRFFLSAAIALSCCDLFYEFAGIKAFIKWPNDIYMGDRKAGGILIENVIQGTEWRYAVVGIGLNINQTEFPENLPNPVSLKQATGLNYDLTEMVKALGKCIEKRMEFFRRNHSGHILVEYNKALYKLNESVALKKKNIHFQARIKGVNEQGKLITQHAVEELFEWGAVEWKI